MQYPKFGFIRQNFLSVDCPDPRLAATAELEKSGILNPVRRGQRVLITCGSRGIESMAAVLGTCIAAVRERGADPVIYPAMGSHGSGTAKGQMEVLRHLGITESTIGAPVYSGLEVVEVDRVYRSVPVFADRAAVEADHILIVNRIKEHTEYIGETESGLLKMAVVGFGRQLGAESMHQVAVNITYHKAIHLIAASLFKNLKVLGGIALLEDHFNRLRRVEAIAAEDVFSREPQLLEESKLYKPTLPFEDLDILVVDEIGKEISGAGMDTKVVGRIMNVYEKECETPRITRIVVLDLSEATDGNATGIGLADYTTSRTVEKTDLYATMTNCVTAVAPEKGRMPLAFKTDREAIDAALKTIGIWTPDQVRIAWISDTKNLEWLAVSRSLLELSKQEKDDLFDLPYDADGNLPKLKDFLQDFSLLAKV